MCILLRGRCRLRLARGVVLVVVSPTSSDGTSAATHTAASNWLLLLLLVQRAAVHCRGWVLLTDVRRLTDGRQRRVSRSATYYRCLHLTSQFIIIIFFTVGKYNPEGWQKVDRLQKIFKLECQSLPPHQQNCRLLTYLLVLDEWT